LPNSLFEISKFLSIFSLGTESLLIFNRNLITKIFGTEEKMSSIRHSVLKRTEFKLQFRNGSLRRIGLQPIKLRLIRNLISTWNPSITITKQPNEKRTTFLNL